MAICSFLGHSEVYDRNMAQRAEEAVLRLAEREEELQFLFSARQDSPFHRACWQGVQKAKERYPEKKFLVRLLAEEEEKPRLEAWIRQRHIPIDQVMAPVRQPGPAAGAGRSLTAALREIARWAIEHSDCLICYIYEEFDPPKARLCRYARQNNVELVQIANGAIRQRIASERQKRPAQEQFALAQKQAGRSYREIARLMNLSDYRIRAMVHAANWAIEREICQNPM